MVAEGVETIEQQEKLMGFGEALGQGFLYAVPITASEVGELLLGTDQLERHAA